MDPLTAHFLHQGIPESEISEIVNAFQFKKIKKGSFFAEEGKTSKHLAFITKGLFQYFYLKDGKEVTTYVTGDNTFLASLSSFYKQKPCKEFVRALLDSELLMLPYNDLLKLKERSNGFRSFYIKALEDLVVAMDDTRTNLIILTAEERYALLMKEEPALLQQIPLQYLASILGVTPRHLSRIRNSIR